MNSAAAASVNQQELLQDVRRRISQLEEAIEQINATKKHLKENSLEVKSQIHATISRQLETLRSREVWLLNQVEVIQHAKEDVLRQQQDQLNQALGGLQNSLEFSTRVVSDMDDSIMDRSLSESLDKLENLALRPEESPYISFRADVPSLRESLYKFGRIDSRGLPIETAFADPQMTSSSLPYMFEDYGDAEHHILYKTVEEIKTKKHKDSSIRVNIPKLSPKPEDWLFQPTSVPYSSVQPSSSQSVFTPFKSKISDWLAQPGVSVPSEVQEGASKMSITQWLCQMRNDAEVEVMEDDFELISPTAMPSETDSSSSIEVVSQAGTSPLEANATALPYFDQISTTPSSQWVLCTSAGLYRPTQKLEYFNQVACSKQGWLLSKSEQQSPCKGLCNTTFTPKSLDIENLDKIFCIEESVSKYFREVAQESSQWLSERNDQVEDADMESVISNQTTSTFTMPNVQDVCRANETCDSFSQCVCDENCGGSGAIIDQAKVSAPSNKWLADPESSISGQTTPAPGFPYFTSVAAESCDWLVKNPALEVSANQLTASSLSYFKTVSNTDSDWLKQYQPSSNKNSPNITSEDFNFCHNGSDAEIWLVSQCSKEQREKEHHEKWEEQSCQSDITDGKWILSSSKSVLSTTDDVSVSPNKEYDVNKWLYAQSENVDYNIKKTIQENSAMQVDTSFSVFESNGSNIQKWVNYKLLSD